MIRFATYTTAKTRNALQDNPQNCLWGPRPHLIHGSLGPPKSTPQTASRSVWPFFWQGSSQQTDTQTTLLHL